MLPRTPRRDGEAKKPTNPLEGFGVISKQQWNEAQAEIERLKAELELRARAISELTEIVEGYLSGNGHDPNEEAWIKQNHPVAYEFLIGNGYPPLIEAHLAGRGSDD